MSEPQDLSGTVRSGRGLGAPRMADPAVARRLNELAGYSIVPGTLNLLLPRPPRRDSRWVYLPSTDIGPDWEAETGQAGYYLAPVTIAARYRGLAFQADERSEPG